MPKLIKLSEEKQEQFDNDYAELVNKFSNSRVNPSATELLKYVNNLVSPYMDNKSADIKLYVRDAINYRLYEDIEFNRKSSTIAEHLGVDSISRELFGLLRSDFLAISQSRMSRGGRSWEVVFEDILTEQGLDFSRQPQFQNKHKYDYMLPSKKYVKSVGLPAKAVSVIECKRKLRERYLQIDYTEIIDNGYTMYLFTTDQAITSETEKKLVEKQIKLIIPKPLHTRFLIPSNVLTIKQFITVAKANVKKKRK
jgi:hypothetical protein